MKNKSVYNAVQSNYPEVTADTTTWHQVSDAYGNTVAAVKDYATAVSIAAGLSSSHDRPLPRGTVIDYCGDQATVVTDSGGPTLRVWVGGDMEGSEQTWFWEFSGIQCTVVGFDEEF